jgi:hypothetical protein
VNPRNLISNVSAKYKSARHARRETGIQCHGW